MCIHADELTRVHLRGEAAVHAFVLRVRQCMSVAANPHSSRINFHWRKIKEGDVLLPLGVAPRKAMSARNTAWEQWLMTVH